MKDFEGFEGFIFDASAIKVQVLSEKLFNQVRSLDHMTRNDQEELKSGFRLIGTVSFHTVLLKLTKLGHLRKIHRTTYKDMLQLIYPDMTDDAYKASFDFDTLPQIFLK